MKQDRKKNLEAVLAIVFALLLLFWIFDFSKWVVFAAMLISILSLLFGFFTDFLGTLWLGFAKGLGFVMGKIILTTVFYLFLTPLALVSKLFRKDTLLLNKKGRKSFYVERNYSFSPKDIENMW